ncbi:diacylglycerol/lipid kinase family protein [Lutimonas sp.]|uniref:diacylglycerol/lipid kinase family protein n=1 Tax=Lutimonas sp. TaxID=1872403 RepID=UPI003D9BF495
MKLLFIVNPISGGVNKEPFLKEAKLLCDKYGISYTVFKTTGKNDKEEALKVIDKIKPDKIASVGGDGTTLFVATLLLGTDYPMGIIPLGSANGMATELYVNLKPIEALKDIILSDIVGGLDMILINGEHYTLHIGDVGINASIVDSYEKDKNRGMITYAKYFLEEMTRLKHFNVTVEANGESKKSMVLMTAICNARKYGTGVPLNIIGNPMDGLFEIVLIEKVDTSSLLAAGLAVLHEEFHDSQTSSVIQTDKAVITFEEPRLLQLDGEVIQKYDRLDIELLKGAVKFITTTENLYYKN